ncbi:D-arabinono-1,4-lactone oxidase [Brasilonema bromeliae]
MSASTVNSFRLMLADGSVVHCSRSENAELFSLVLGGYGLFGIILDVDLQVVKNEMYLAQRVIIPTQQYVDIFEELVNRVTDIGMVYGRISVAPDYFLKEAILTIYRRNPSKDGKISPLNEHSRRGLTRTVFRGEVGSNYGKNLRWQLEKALGGEAGSNVSRNQILNRSSKLLENQKLASTDILHEYFIPPKSMETFLEKCRTIIPKHNGDLLNITVRNVHRDSDSFLRYADQNLFGLVMLFHQHRTPNAEVQMKAMTTELIDAVLSVGGRYYLPYRLHATKEQFARAYPQAQEFFALKRKYDSKEVFQNQFYLKYGKQ